MSIAPKNQFPNRLQAQREQRGLSQEALAKRSGMQPTAISHFETGARKPSFDNLRRLADALETTVDYLMGRTDTSATVTAAGDQLFRDFHKLTTEDRDIARDFMASLAKRSKERKG
jgi:transcriptional regulator with XRE-family HTH domain